MTAMRRLSLVIALLAAAATPAAAQVVLGPGGPPQGAPVPVAGTGTAAISGVVVDAVSGRPVAGAVVTLAYHERLSSRSVSRMSTDALGRFVFTKLPAFTTYYLHSSRFGYFDGGLGREVPGEEAGRPIALGEGQWVRDVEIRMTRASSVSGRVTDEAGEPVVDVPVRALPVITLAGVEHVANGLMATTDDRGEYRIYGLAPGRYFIAVPSVQAAVPAATTPFALAGVTESQFVNSERAGRPPEVPATLPVPGGQSLVLGTFPVPPSPRGAPQAYPPTFYPSARTIGAAVTVEPEPGVDRAGIDIQLRPERAANVAGRVVGPSEAVSGLVLRLMPVGSEAVGIGAEAATSLVGPNGAFTFVNVPTGRYTLMADRLILQYHYTPMGTNLDTTMPRPAGFDRGRGGAGNIPGASPGVGYDYTSLENADSYWGRMDVTVPDAGIDDIVLTLQPTMAIRGRIVWEGGEPAPPTRATMTPNGLVMGPADTLPVSAEPADGNPLLGMPRGEYVIATKVFSVGGLRPGEYILHVSGLPAVKSVMWNGRDYTDQPFDTSGGNDFDDVVITVTNQPATVTGTVRDDGGQLASAGLVLAFPTDSRLWTRFGFSPARLQDSPIANDGSYALKLPAGEYYLAALEAVGRDGWRAPAFLERLVAGATRIRVDWGQSASETITMRGGR